MKFWKNSKKGSSSRSLTNSSSNNNPLLTRDDDYVLSKKKQPSTFFATTSVPTRHQRMQLLNSLIHHADRVQSQFATNNDTTSESNNSNSNSMIKSLTTSNSSAVQEMNTKAFNRWQAVLQEGLVPLAVRGLGLLEPIEQQQCSSSSSINDDEEEYFASLQGMDAEIQMMAILGRAASLRDRTENSCDDDDVIRESIQFEEDEGDDDDGMEQINSMMKCTAMLMFHVVMMASAPSSSDAHDKEVAAEAGNDSKNTVSSAGFDSRVRHVLKMACVDVLTRAILQSVDVYEKKAMNQEQLQSAETAAQAVGETESKKLYDIDEFTLWNIPNIKVFVDEHVIGKEAIFGTVWQKQSAEKFALLGKKQGSKQQMVVVQEQQNEDQELQSSASEQRLESDEFPSIEEMHSDLLLTDETDEEESAVSESGDGVVAETIKDENKSDEVAEQSIDLTQDNNDNKQDPTDQQPDNAPNNGTQDNELNQVENEQEQQLKLQQAEKEAHQAKRQLNAKFLASRKYELVERIVAIDVVRFLMAEERERKLREREQKNKFMNVVEMIKKATAEEESEPRDDVVLQDDVEGESSERASSSGDGNDLQSSEGAPGSESGSSYWTSHRKKQALRSLKIAGVGLTLGTVFAVTGGLAAPALAAGIGGLASLTGAGTASSTAILAVLATFKAGAALFGVGGGGLAAYRMKKRTDGLSDFSIRRENIEQYMYPGASDAKMKKGIEAMLPHLHTTVAVSGWLRENDIDDFQLAWGICPNGRDDKSKNDEYRIRQLKRFYSIYNPKLVQYCEDFMWYLQRKQKKEFSWERIWIQLEAKYGANPDRMLPIDKPYNDEILLSAEEKELIEGVLNTAKVVVGKQRGCFADIDFNENDEIMQFLDKVSPTKKNQTQERDQEIDPSLVDNLEERMMNEDISASINSIRLEDKNDDDGDASMNGSSVRGQDHNTDMQQSGIHSNASSIASGTDHSSPSEINYDSTSPICESNTQKCTPSADQDAKDEDDQGEERCPVVWDWTRLYGSDLHTVTWESKMLSSLCHIVENMAIEVSSQATKAALQYSVIGAIISAVALPSALLTASKLIDDPYQIVVIRADEAGKELAKCLLLSDERRPVTLVGFSFGARVIYSCLRELARQQDIWEEERNNQGAAETSLGQSSKTKEKTHFKYDREPASLIADVIFIGLPRVIDKLVLTSCRRVTGGRFVNCYAKNDWLLSLMFVARGGTPCGTKPILDVPGVENYDVTSLVESHTKYADAIPNILKLVRFCEP